MKKLQLPLVVLLVLAFVITGCSSATSTTSSAPPSSSSTASPQPQGTSTPPTSITAAPSPSQSPTAAPSPTSTPPPITSAEPAPSPVYGGTLKIIVNQGPANIGYFPTQTFQDETFAPTWSDRLFDLDTQGNLVPNLALSYDYPPDAKYIIVHLRLG